MGSTLIYYQRVPTDGARRLGCAGILDLCSRLPASGLLRPEARWPDKVLFSAEKSGALRAKAASRLWPAGQVGNGFGASGGDLENSFRAFCTAPKEKIPTSSLDTVHKKGGAAGKE